MSLHGSFHAAIADGTTAVAFALLLARTNRQRGTWPRTKGWTCFETTRPAGIVAVQTVRGLVRLPRPRRRGARRLDRLDRLGQQFRVDGQVGHDGQTALGDDGGRHLGSGRERVRRAGDDLVEHVDQMRVGVVHVGPATHHRRARRRLGVRGTEAWLENFAA